jgi:hypothetical protein
MSILSTILALLLAINPQKDTTEVITDFPVLHFRLDKYSFDDNYLENLSAIDSIASIINYYGVDNIRSIKITAYASPEGVREHNLQLSKRRATALRRICRRELPDVFGLMSFRAGGESWTLLRERIVADEKISAYSKKKILRILDNRHISDDTRKWRLENKLGHDDEVGNLYKYLLREHYKYLRCGITVAVVVKSSAAGPADSTSSSSSSPGSSHIPSGMEQPGDTTIDIQVVDTTSAIQPGDTTSVTPPADTTSPIQPADTTSNIQPVDTSSLIQPADTTAVTPPADTTAGIHIGPCVDGPLQPVTDRKPRRPIIGISTNLPYDMTYIPGYGLTSVPSLSVEYYPAMGKYSFGADLDYSHWLHPDTHRYNQIHNLTLWGRRYFTRDDDRFRGAYLLANVNAVQYGLGFNANEGYEGEGLGIGAGAGWKVYIGQRFYLDMGGTLGLLYSRYDPYTWGGDGTGRYYYDYTGDPASFVTRRKRLVWFGPTRVFISVGFDIYGNKR